MQNTYEIQTPDGAVYEVTAPSEQEALAALGLGGAPQAPSRPRQAAETGLLQSATLNAADEISGGIAAGLIGVPRGIGAAVREGDMGAIPREIGRTYRESAQMHRGDAEALRQSNPGAFMAGEFAGMLAPAAAAAPAVVGARTLGGAAVRGAATGAAGGATAGFFAGEGDAADRTPGAVGGAAIGAGFGAALPVFGAKLARVWTARRARKMQNVSEPEKQAFDQVVKTMTDDLGSRGAAEAHLRKWQREGADPNTLIDEALPGTSMLIREVMSQKPTTGLKLINEWKDAMGTRAKQAVRSKLSPEGQTVGGIKDKLKVIRETQAAPLYEAAYGREIPQQTYLTLIAPRLRTDAARRAIARGLTLVDAQEDTATKALLRQALQNPSSVTLTVKAMDQIKKGFDDEIGKRMKAGNKQIAAALIDAKDRFVSAIDEVAPEYRRAREVWGGAAQAEEAVDFGRDLLVGRRTAEDVAAELQGMTPAQIDFVRIGLADALEQQIAKTPDGSNMARWINREDTRAKIRAVFGDAPQDAEELVSLVQKLEEQYSRRNFLAPTTGSQTELRDRVRKELEERARSGAGNRIVGTIDALTNPQGATRRFVDDNLDQGARARFNAISTELEKLLLQGDANILRQLDPPQIAPSPNLGAVPGMAAAQQAPQGSRQQ